MKCMITENGFVTALCDLKVLPENAIKLTDTEYAEILDTIRNKPQDTETEAYRLDAETLVYVITEPDKFDDEGEENK